MKTKHMQELARALSSHFINHTRDANVTWEELAYSLDRFADSLDYGIDEDEKEKER